MKHATPAALDRIESFLNELRKLKVLKEKSRGTFYLGSRAFLHFHEHGDEFYADARIADDFERFPATTAAQRKMLLRALKSALKS